MSDEQKIQGMGPLKQPDSIKLPKLKFELPTFQPIFNFNKPVETPQETKKKSISQELHDSWTKVFPRLSQEFFDELTAMAERINCKPEDLAAIMFKESRFDPAAKGAGVYGLIQMNATALKVAIAHANKNGHKLKNVTISEYHKMPREQQIKYSEAYIQFRIDEKKLTGKKLSGGQLWTLIKRPASINNKKFINKLQKIIDNAKNIPLNYDTPYSLKHSN